MNNIIKRKWNQNSMVIIEDLQGMAFQAESGGHTFQISGVDGEGNTVTLSGTPAGVMLRSDGQDVTLTCSVSEGVVSATLPANAYSVPGRFGLTIFLTSDGQKTAIYAAVGTVGKTSSGTVAPPAGSDVVDLVNAIAAAVATIPANYTDLMASVAPTYSSSGLYAVGSYAWYNGKLYRCTTAITSGETWTSGHWTLANLGSDLVDLKSALSFETRNLFDPFHPINLYGCTSSVEYIDGKPYVKVIPTGGSANAWFKVLDNAANHVGETILIKAQRGTYTGEAPRLRVGVRTADGSSNVSSITDLTISGNEWFSFYEIPNVNSGIVCISLAGVGASETGVYKTFYDIYVATGGENGEYVPFLTANDFIARNKVNDLKEEVISSNDLIKNGLYTRCATSGYLNRHNRITSDGETSYTSNLIPCSPGDKFYYSGTFGQNAVACVFLLDGVVVDHVTKSSISQSEETITIPNGVNQVRFGSYHNVFEAYPIGALIDILLSASSSILGHKKWYAFGDSFTHGDFTGYVDPQGHTGTDSDAYDSTKGMYKTWAYWIAKRNNMKLTNLAVNGAKTTYLTTNDLYKSVPLNCDYVTFMLGLNDTSASGDIDSTDPTTWHGAWNVTLNWLRANRPHTRVGIIIPPSWLGNSWRSEIEAVANRHGIPFLNLYSDPKVPALLGSLNGSKLAKKDMDQAISIAVTQNNVVSDSNEHPNVECFRQMSDSIEVFMNGL